MCPQSLDTAIGFLSYERPDHLLRGLEALARYLPDFLYRSRRFVYDNGSSPIALTSIRKIAQDYDAKFIEIGKHLPPTQDYAEREKRYSQGHLELARVLLSCDASVYLIHEDDWECVSYAPLEDLVNYLKAHQATIGQIRLRKCEYDGGLTGYQRHNFVTGEPLKWYPLQQVASATIQTANLHWTNNPSLVHRDALKVMARGFSTELECMRLFYEIYKLNAQLVPGIFVHTGPWRTRQDLIEKGIVRPGG